MVLLCEDDDARNDCLEKCDPEGYQNWPIMRHPYDLRGSLKGFPQSSGWRPA